MNDIIDEYAQWMYSWRASPRTVTARVGNARKRLAAWGGIDGYTPANIRAYLGSNPDWSAWTYSTYRNHIGSFCEFLVSCGYMSVSPMDSVRTGRRPENVPRPLSEEQVDLLLATATGRTRDWLTIALSSGLRAHEIAKIRGEDVSATGIFVLGKGNKEAVLPAHDDILSMALRYPRNGYWFPSPHGSGHIQANTISSTVSALFASLGIEGSIHRCRHTYGTRLLRTGMNIRRVQTLMRHGRLETTALYTAVDEDELRAAINMLPSSA